MAAAANPTRPSPAVATATTSQTLGCRGRRVVAEYEVVEPSGSDREPRSRGRGPHALLAGQAVCREVEALTERPQD